MKKLFTGFFPSGYPANFFRTQDLIEIGNEAITIVMNWPLPSGRRRNSHRQHGCAPAKIAGAAGIC